MHTNSFSNVVVAIELLNEEIENCLATPSLAPQLKMLLKMTAQVLNTTQDELQEWQKDTITPMPNTPAVPLQIIPTDATKSALHARRRYSNEYIVARLQGIPNHRLRYERRYAVNYAVVCADGSVRDLNTGMRTDSVLAWATLLVEEDKSEGYRTTATVNQYDQIDVLVGDTWMMLGDFLASCDHGKDTSSGAAWAA